MEKINYTELKNLKDRGENIALINVLLPEDFKKGNIPGSVNIPGNSPDFESRVEKLIGGKDKPVIVYCASFECPASKNAAEKLEQAGFTKVKCYEGGTKEWQEKSGSKQAA